MKNVRIGVFETNSSSTHSISIGAGTGGMYDTIVPDENGDLVLQGGEFGWEWEQYNDAITKANYAAVFSDKSDALRALLTEVLVEHTGAHAVRYDLRDSYIDHQSDIGEDGAALEAFKNAETLKDFIFLPESWLRTGNDNEEGPW